MGCVPIIVALDSDDLKEAQRLVDALCGVVKIFKVGSILFAAHGLAAIEMVQQKGGEVFLDLKFHDIPNTVKKVSSVVARHKVFMFNVHTAGGEMMMAEAARAAQQESERLNIRRPLVLGVTVLTSIDENTWRDLGAKGDINAEVVHWAQLSQQAGLDGVVASPEDAPHIRANLGSDFIIVSPGIRPGWAKLNQDDQKRFTTPKQAIEGGADYIVLGRPISEARDPRQAAEKIIAEICKAKPRTKPRPN